MSIFSEIENKAEETKLNSFKTKRRHLKRSFSRSTKSVAIDDFGNPYRASQEIDKVIGISLTLPQSLINALDEKRGEIPRSRYMREVLEYALDLENTENITVKEEISSEL